MNTLIPAAKWDAVQTALQTAFHTIKVDRIELLAGGLSSALVYKVVVGGRPYVLRLLMEIDELRDPARQFVCMNHATAAGIAPAVHYANVDEAVAITDFIATQPLSKALASPEERLHLLAHTVKAIHALPLFPHLVNFLDGVDRFIERFHTLALLPVSATAEHFSAYAEIQRVYPRHDPDLVASHNDLNPNNMLFDGQQIWIIDWEAAFRNDRYVDLAIAARPFVTDEAQETFYLQAYFGGLPTRYQRARYFLMQQVCHLYYAMIMMQMAAAQKPADVVANSTMQTGRLHEFHSQVGTGTVSLATYEGQLGYGKTLLNEALYNMRKPTFSAALRTVVSGEDRSAVETAD